MRAITCHNQFILPVLFVVSKFTHLTISYWRIWIYCIKDTVKSHQCVSVVLLCYSLCPDPVNIVACKMCDQTCLIQPSELLSHLQDSCLYRSQWKVLLSDGLNAVWKAFLPFHKQKENGNARHFFLNFGIKQWIGIQQHQYINMGLAHKDIHYMSLTHKRWHYLDFIVESEVQETVT